MNIIHSLSKIRSDGLPDREKLFSELSRHGAILFRDPAMDLMGFSTFVDQVTPKTAIDPARSFFAKNVQLVDSGTSEIGLHCENATTPLVPEVVWFYCERAAESGSQTILCDGVEVWKRLTSTSKSVLQSDPIRFSRNVKRDLWEKYVRHHFSHLSSVETVSQGDLDGVFGPIPGARAEINADGSLYLSQSVWAARPSAFDRTEGAPLAFANSLFGPSYNYEAPDVRFDNGTQVPSEVLEECSDLAEELTTEIAWKSGDVVMIDNTRVMHGRRKITDLQRKIFTALGFINRAPGAGAFI